MNVVIKTKVEQSMEQVWANFGEALFRALNPPFPPVVLHRFDGSKVDDEVHLELNFLLFKQKWVSKITECQTSAEECFFIDVGVKLPFFLASWQHKHRILAQPDGSAMIIDEISYTAPLPGMALLLKPTMLAQFLYRKPVYQRFFKQSASTTN